MNQYVIQRGRIWCFLKLLPNCTVGSGRLSGRKKKKYRVAFLASSTSSGNERLPLLGIGKIQKPRCFADREVSGASCVYCSNSKAWMTRDLFFEWLLQFDSYTGGTTGSVWHC